MKGGFKLTGFSLLLVVLAAFCHAAWNYIAKKVCGGTTFIWLFSCLSALIYFPLLVFVLFVQSPEFKPYYLIFMLGSAALHSIYFVLLDKGYKVGEFSIIYPLARGTGPLLSTLIAIFFLNEKPTVLALCGIFLIIIGTLLISGTSFQLKGLNSRNSIIFALLCGTAIAAYTILDKMVVSILLLPPVLMDWCTNFGRVLLLSPHALKNRNRISEQWHTYKKEITIVAILSPMAYILVLTAMIYSPVSYVAPAREISILIGTIMGAKLLSESHQKTRLGGALTMFIGLIALGLG